MPTWNRSVEPGSEGRVGLVDYDSELRLHNVRLRESFGIRPTDRVLDIGCGTGQTTRDAGRMASAGRAHGVDSSTVMIQRAGDLTRAEGLRNVTFQHADAESSRFPHEPYDLAISRFGTMFFTNPTEAFANIARALRQAARLVMMVWQGHDQNEWAVSIDEALDERGSDPATSAGVADPFSLANPTVVQRLLSFADFAEVTFTDVHEPVFYGPNVDSALDFVTGFQTTKHALESLDPTSAQAAIDRLHQTLASHQTTSGVWFDSRSWIVTARHR